MLSLCYKRKQENFIFFNRVDNSDITKHFKIACPAVKILIFRFSDSKVLLLVILKSYKSLLSMS